MDLSAAKFTKHALLQAKRRNISKGAIHKVLQNPEAVIPVREGRVVVQGMHGKSILLRVFVDIDRQPPEIVTVYKTSKIEKYRRPK